MEAHLAGNLIPVVATMRRSSVSEDSVADSTVTVKVIDPDGTITDIELADDDVDDSDEAQLVVTARWNIPDDAVRGIYVIEFDSNDPLVAAVRIAIYVLPRQTVSSGS